MHTAHLLPVSPSMHCSRGVPAQGELPAQGGLPLGGVPAGGYTCLGVYLPSRGVPTRRVYLPGGVPARGCTCPGTPPLWTEFLTHATENITLPQTSFAGGNNGLLKCSFGSYENHLQAHWVPLITSKRLQKKLLVMRLCLL